MADVTKTCRDISELTPTAQKACNLFMAKCKAAGLNVLITETYRSQERQNYLYKQGRTRSGQVVTWTLNSRHTSRRAWDICKNVKGQEYSDSSFFKACGMIAAELGITWGGTWKTPDTPHFEVDEKWNYEGDEEVTEADRIKFNAMVDIVEGLTKRVHEMENPMVYNYIDANSEKIATDCNECLQFLVDKGALKGNENGELGLDYNMIRLLLINYRVGIYK